jgi:two-component system response regulator FixJ
MLPRKPRLPILSRGIVYIVDDDDAVGRSLENLLEAVDFSAMAFATPQDFLGVAPGLPPGCVLLDLKMPELNGLEVQQRLCEMNVALPVILMTGQGDIRSAVAAMKAGAVDFIEKPYDDDALLQIIESVLKSTVKIDRSAERAAARERVGHLTPRERQVLDALVAGHVNKAIAFELGISVRTVEVHRARMMDRLGVHQFAEALRLAVLAGLPPEWPPN